MKMQKTFNKDLIFYIVMLAFPVLQFCLFYIGVNGRSFLFSFQKIWYDSNLTRVTEFSLDSIKLAFENLTGPDLGPVLGTSFLAFVCTYFIGTTLALLFSYFIYKKLPMGNFFKVVLFLPSIVSGIVVASIFMSFFDNAYSEFAKTEGLFTNLDTRLPMVIFFNIFVGFGTSVLMYSNAMSGLSQEVIEAGRIDGCNQFREFFHIVLPGVFPTFTTFTITSVATIFTNQLALMSFYSTSVTTSENLPTIGYYLYVKTLEAGDAMTEYPYLSAIGLLLTLVAVPLTLTVKTLLEKYGPSDR
jgi:ABC-type sugar transport system permease subunit